MTISRKSGFLHLLASVFVFFTSTHTVLADPGDVLGHLEIGYGVGGFVGEPGDQDDFGCSMTDLGDLDGPFAPGIRTIAVGAISDSDAGASAGAVWLLNLSDTAVIGERKLTWGLPTRSFGRSLANLGDTDGPLGPIARTLVVTSADYYSPYPGTVWFVDIDEAGRFLSYSSLQDNQFGAEGTLWGSSVAVLGDLDGEGPAVYTIAVGAPMDNDGEGSALGAIWIIGLDASFNALWSQKISNTQGGFQFNPYVGLFNGDNFGSSLAPADITTWQGHTHLLVGAPYNDSCPPFDVFSNRGRIFGLGVNPDGTVNYQWSNNCPELNDSEYFGRAVADLGDLDADGINDFAVGADGFRLGFLYLFLSDGPNPPLPIDALAYGYGGSFGRALCPIPDLNGDGKRDLVVGAYESIFILFLDGAACDVYPQLIQFGNAAVGESIIQTTQITNTGPVSISGTITLESTEFQLIGEPGSYALGPGENLDLTVVFRPTTEGPHQAYVNLGDNYCADVRLLGTGCADQRVVHVDENAMGANDGTSWDDAFNELTDALIAPDNGCPGPKEIWIAGGIYKPGIDETDTFNLTDGVTLRGGFSGTENFLFEREHQGATTILSGEIGSPAAEDNVDHVLTIGGFDVLVDHVVVRDGHNITEGGAGIQVTGTGKLTDVLVESNWTDEVGGGIRCWNQSNLDLENVVVRDNHAGKRGGGLFADDSELQLVDVLFTGNHAENQDGGAIAVERSTAYLGNLTMVGNTSSGGAAAISVRSGGSALLANSIVWDNTGSGGQTFDVNNSTSVHHSLVQGSGGSGAGWDSGFGFDGGDNLDADPVFNDPFSNDYSLDPSSPAVNSGDNSVGILPNLDLNGSFRILQGVVDRGAYELNPVSPVTEDPGPIPGYRVIGAVRIYPNPANPMTKIDFELKMEADVSVEIFDVSGHLIRTLQRGRTGPGAHTTMWDGRDVAGRPLASGAYLARVKAAGESWQGSILLLK